MRLNKKKRNILKVQSQFLPGNNGFQLVKSFVEQNSEEFLYQIFQYCRETHIIFIWRSLLPRVVPIPLPRSGCLMNRCILAALEWFRRRQNGSPSQEAFVFQYLDLDRSRIFVFSRARSEAEFRQIERERERFRREKTTIGR